MKKKLLIAVMLIICLLSLFACSESFSYQALPGGPNINDEIVGGNSGICVQKGDYIYMINGMADTTADNNFGDAVRGAIYRLELNPATGEIIETLLMAPKAFYSKEQGAGLYIPDNGNKLYYISPSTEKDKNGDRLYWYYDIFSVNLNGTETRKMGTIDYYNTGKFLQIGSEVCFVYEPTIIDKTDNKILAMKENGQIVECLKGYEKAIIGEDGNIYYTKEQEKDADKEISGIEDYNKV
ncbi:MAG: hypothetical protein FWG51_02575, partial [Firmicutes bacterium]|nr:hypothetical protein [Bacillota bacterium]